MALIYIYIFKRYDLGSADSTGLSENTEKRRAIVDEVMNLRVL